MNPSDVNPMPDPQREGRDPIQDRPLAETSQRLAAHIDNSPLGVIELDPDLRIVRWSGGAERLFGWTADEVLGRAVFELRWVHEDDLEGCRQVTVELLTHRQPRNRHVNRNYRKDGSVVHCEWYNSVIFDAEGRLTSILSQVLDVSERKLAEQELGRARRAAEERAAELDAVLQAVPAAVWIAHDPDCRHITGNRTADEWLRLPAGAEASLTASEGVRPTHFKICQQGRELGMDELPMQRAARGVEVRDFEEEIVFADGTVRPCLGNATPLWDGQGRPRGSVAAFVDITNLRRAKEALSEAARRKDEFLATLAHELRNPLVPMRNAAEILRRHSSDAPMARAARDLIERQVRYISRLVEDLMDLSRIARGGLLLRREPVELSAVLDHALATILCHAQCAGRDVQSALPEQPVWVDADPMRLEQVFLNLLSNACKFTGKGGHIRLTAELQGQEAVVTVADSGIGIAAEHLSQVFDMFAQVGLAADEGQGGLGIGLALARRLVEMHGGSIQARSEGPGHGSEFVVRLPALNEPARLADTAQADGARPASGAALRVLVVDDNRDVAESLAMLLRVNGHEAETAHDGVEAVEVAARYRPDVVLLDLSMPRLDGYATCHRMRGQPWGRDLRIIAMSGRGLDADPRGVDEAGFETRLVKPVKPSELLRVLGEAQARRG